MQRQRAPNERVSIESPTAGLSPIPAPAGRGAAGEAAAAWGGPQGHMAVRLAIFDFDGTLADTFPWFAANVNEAARRFGVRTVDADDAQRLRELPARGVFRELGVAWWKVPAIARHMHRRMAEDIDGIGLFEGVAEMLAVLHGAGVVLAIATSNARANVERLLGPQRALIRHLECGVAVHGKRARIRRILRAAGVAPAEAVAIGDEIRDIEAARAVGVAAWAVPWGYNSRAALLRHRPDRLIERIDEVPRLFGAVRFDSGPNL